MTFSQKVKEELISKKLDSDCCNEARLAGIILSAGSLCVQKNKITFEISTENEDLISYVISLIKKLYNYEFDEIVLKYNVKGSVCKKDLCIPFEIGEEILLFLGIICRNGGGNLVIKNELDHHLVMEDCCKKSLLGGVFLGSGTISLPKEGSSGYHFEVAFSSYYVCHDVMEIFASLDLFVKMIERKDEFVIYVKESQLIFDILATCGAVRSSLDLQNAKVQRELNNSINRQSNCQSANIDKAVSSAVKEVVAIQNIQKTIGLDCLDEKLRIVAEKRLDNPCLALGDLLKTIPDNLTKSGLRYRLEKIISISKEIMGG